MEENQISKELKKHQETMAQIAGAEKVEDIKNENITENIMATSPVYPGIPLRMGSSGSNVTIMQSYLNAINAGGFCLEETIFFDDHTKYTDGYQKIGGTAVLVRHPKMNQKNPHPINVL